MDLSKEDSEVRQAAEELIVRQLIKSSFDSVFQFHASEVKLLADFADISVCAIVEDREIFFVLRNYSLEEWLAPSGKLASGAFNIVALHRLAISLQLRLLVPVHSLCSLELLHLSDLLRSLVPGHFVVLESVMVGK